MLALHRASPLDGSTSAASGSASGGGSEAAAGAVDAPMRQIGRRQVSTWQGKTCAVNTPVRERMNWFFGAGPADQLAQEKPKACLNISLWQDDDDLFLGMRALGGGGRKKGGGLSLGSGGGGGRPLALPHAGAVGGASYRLAEVAAADITGICRVKIRCVDGWGGGGDGGQ